MNNIFMYCVYKRYSIFILFVAIVLKARTYNRCLIILYFCNNFLFHVTRKQLTLCQWPWLRKFVFLYDKLSRSYCEYQDANALSSIDLNNQWWSNPGFWYKWLTLIYRIPLKKNARKHLLRMTHPEQSNVPLILSRSC